MFQGSFPDVEKRGRFALWACPSFLGSGCFGLRFAPVLPETGRNQVLRIPHAHLLPHLSAPRNGPSLFRPVLNYYQYLPVLQALVKLSSFPVLHMCCNQHMFVPVTTNNTIHHESLRSLCFDPGERRSFAWRSVRRPYH